MIKWEYLYVEATDDEVIYIDEKRVKESSGHFHGVTDRLNIHKFLEEIGLEGWELAGINTVSESEGRWRMILKRPLP
ncbi:MAG: hypothetical protein KA473_09755 [Anaerolineales bacterium]|nr:hypothetical protein [Anaerolineales bacterium]MBP6209716.1 hypothetical protein [Anaerolineales bacterium]MBP8164606.1 hypothetical protein [Anaerolineales bacterium]